jgi:hypothetical protein
VAISLESGLPVTISLKCNAYYYKVGDVVTTDKYTALLEKKQTGNPIEFKIPEFITKGNLHIDPQQSIHALCKNHAIRLRESYDYVRLFFSGGSDSQLILDTFVRNNIHIDEIVMVKSGIPTTDYELDDVASKMLANNKNALQTTKITVSSMTTDEYRRFYVTDRWYENLIDIGRSTRVGGTLRQQEYKESINLYPTHGKTVSIFGIDKPFVKYLNGKWYTYFLDVNLEYQEGESDWCSFYYDDPLICAKQCHDLIRSIETNLSKTEYNKVTTYDRQYQKLWQSAIGRLDYQNYFIPKALGHNELPVNNYKDYLAWKTLPKDNDMIWKNYQYGLKNLESMLGKEWFNDGQASLGTVGIFGPFIDLQDGSVHTVDELYPNGYYD